MKLVAAFLIFLALYTVFWVKFFSPKKAQIQQIQPVSNNTAFQAKNALTDIDQKKPDVLGSSSIQPPASYHISFIPRKQQFGLSCEFSAAASVIYHYTGLPEFSQSNSLSAEKTLIEKVGVSNNPNLGIRMGDSLPRDLQTLYTNLNQRFGGADYYGVHAPPFIDVFREYGLSSRILENNVSAIQQALYKGHVVMAWIQIGYKEPIDTALSYGAVTIIRGEHSVVIHGYDATGFEIMDPGTGINRHVDYETIIKAAKAFTVPFLEIYPLPKEGATVEEAVQLGSATGLVRYQLRLSIENASGKPGVASELGAILRDFGYSISDIKTAKKTDEEGIVIRIKDQYKDFLYILSRDLKVAHYSIATMSATLPSDSTNDAVIEVRE